jgi:phosphatidylserine/phosphatidylglycerophosphate/cardiolipin synthase-like enzyme
MNTAFEVSGTNATAPFTLKAHRGDGMVLLAMNWKAGTPPDDFVGFGLEYREPARDRWWPVTNRLAFPGVDGAVDPNAYSTLRSPIQKFRWVHFPFHPDLPGLFTYRVTPVFAGSSGALSFGEAQELQIALSRETYPGELNVAYTRGFVSSQAFVDRYGKDAIPTLIPANAVDGLTFVPTHPKAQEAYDWMGFEARRVILDLLDEALADPAAQVRVVAYDFNLPEIVDRLEQLGPRLRIVIDNSADHGAATSAESQAASRLATSAGAANVQRQHVGHLQHNKTVVVDGPQVQAALCGSTNLSWRGFFVQSNNAVVVRGANAIAPFAAAFDAYWDHGTAVDEFSATASADWTPLGLAGIDAEVTFSPHSDANAALHKIAEDVGTKTTSSLLYSLAFLYQTPGEIQDAIKAVMMNPQLFVYGISDRKVGGLEVQTPDGKVAPVYPSQLTGRNAPEPFKSEPTGGKGVRMHHKFLVVDFDQPTARVYLGSYNFSMTADTRNGENLVLVRDRRIAVSYAVEALSMFDHYEFRVLQAAAKTAKKVLQLALPPTRAGDAPWWKEDWTDPRKIRDRELFA